MKERFLNLILKEKTFIEIYKNYEYEKTQRRNAFIKFYEIL